MHDVLTTARKVAASDLGVIIIGEHGTGKEWLARIIHRLSRRNDGPFWPFDCAAISPQDIEKELFGSEEIERNGMTIRRGAFEEARLGTLLLNEVDSLPAATQLKVSRAIEFKSMHRIGNDKMMPIDVRVIATLSQPVNPLIDEGTLSKDMFYRIGPIILELPPLRTRKEDIPQLINKILSELRNDNGNTFKEIGADALNLCLSYDWPGNVRQLKNAMEYASVMATDSLIKPEHLPGYLQNRHNGKTA